MSPTANNLVSFLSDCCNLVVVYSKKLYFSPATFLSKRKRDFFKICKHIDRSMPSQDMFHIFVFCVVYLTTLSLASNSQMIRNKESEKL